jgi:hypothetical protein
MSMKHLTQEEFQLAAKLAEEMTEIMDRGLARARAREDTHRSAFPSRSTGPGFGTTGLLSFAGFLERPGQSVVTVLRRLHPAVPGDMAYASAARPW